MDIDKCKRDTVKLVQDDVSSGEKILDYPPLIHGNMTRQKEGLFLVLSIYNTFISAHNVDSILSFINTNK